MYHLNIIDKTKVWYSISISLIILSIVSLFIFGLNLGIDFTGGSMLDIQFKNIERPSVREVKNILKDFKLSNLKIQATGDKAYIIRMQNIDEKTHQAILKKFNEQFAPQEINKDNQNLEKNKTNSEPKIVKVEGSGEMEIKTDDLNNFKKDNIIEEKKFDSIGPVIGNELKEKSIWAVIIVLIAIILYIAYVFRKVSKPVESWKYGLSAIIALAHDVIIIMGVFSVLGHFLNVEIDAFFISAVLTILGFSVNDTIVTFDRIRENLHKKQNLTFKELINVSINETITRSINTSLTTFMVLLSVFIFGGETIKYFVLALILGVIIGTYSSIFIASPLLLFWYKRKYY